jgi:hypothetical protein
MRFMLGGDLLLLRFVVRKIRLKIRLTKINLKTNRILN